MAYHSNNCQCKRVVTVSPEECDDYCETVDNQASDNGAELLYFEDLACDETKEIPNQKNYSVNIYTVDPSLPIANQSVVLEYKPKRKFDLCPTPNYVYNLSEKVIFTTRCMSWNCPACKELMKLRQWLKLRLKIDDRGTEGLKVIAFTLAGPYDKDGVWVEIGAKFSYFRRRLNSKRKCSHCPNSIRYPEGFKGVKIPKDGYCFGASEDGICRYQIDEYYCAREIQMKRLEKTGIAVRHLHMLGWFSYIPWHLIKHYWPAELGDFKIQSLERKDPYKAASYIIKYLNKDEPQALFHKGERRYSHSRGFFEGMDKAGNKIPEIIEEWKTFLTVMNCPEDDIWIVTTYWATPVRIIMKLLARESIAEHLQDTLL